MSYLAFHDSITFVRGIRTDMHEVFHEDRKEIVFLGLIGWVGADFGVDAQNEVGAGAGEVLEGNTREGRHGCKDISASSKEAVGKELT